MAKHTNNGACPKCEEFLIYAEISLAQWFRSEQSKDYTLHCSTSYRGEEAQKAALEGGFSKASFGSSPHNYKPALALDLFFIDANGKAQFLVDKYQKLAHSKPDLIIWGADWNDNGRTDDERFEDSPHFELKNWKLLARNYPNGNK